MSWSVGAHGMSDAVAKTIEEQFNGLFTSPEPEETVKQSVRTLIAQVLAANNPPAIRTVTAYGSQSERWDPGKPGQVQNTLSIIIS